MLSHQDTDSTPSADEDPSTADAVAADAPKTDKWKELYLDSISCSVTFEPYVDPANFPTGHMAERAAVARAGGKNPFVPDAPPVRASRLATNYRMKENVNTYLENCDDPAFVKTFREREATMRAEAEAKQVVVANRNYHRLPDADDLENPVSNAELREFIQEFLTRLHLEIAELPTCGSVKLAWLMLGACVLGLILAMVFRGHLIPQQRAQFQLLVDTPASNETALTCAHWYDPVTTLTPCLSADAKNITLPAVCDAICRRMTRLNRDMDQYEMHQGLFIVFTVLLTGFLIMRLSTSNCGDIGNMRLSLLSPALRHDAVGLFRRVNRFEGVGLGMESKVNEVEQVLERVVRQLGR